VQQADQVKLDARASQVLLVQLDDLVDLDRKVCQVALEHLEQQVPREQWVHLDRMDSRAYLVLKDSEVNQDPMALLESLVQQLQGRKALRELLV